MATKKRVSPEQKAELVSELEEVAHFMEILGENDFKVRAFRKGAQAIEASHDELEDVVTGKVKIAGVGEGLKGAVREFLVEGHVKQHAELKAKIPQGVLEFTTLPGLGAKKALLIQKELGISTLGELEYACRENRLLELKGFGSAIQKNIINAIEERKVNAGKMRFDEVEAHLRTIEKKFRANPFTPVGEFGRHAAIIEHLELFFENKPTQLATSEIKSKNIKLGEQTFKLRYATGSLSNVSMKMTSWWLEKPAPASKILLTWLYADEEMRKSLEVDQKLVKKLSEWNSGWIESCWIGAKRSPDEKTYSVEKFGAVKGIFHCHTNYSDGTATLEDMVKEAERLGYEYIGISDHSQSAFYAQGLKVDRIQEQSEMIKQLQKKVSIRIFHGIESDILSDGKLDYEKEILKKFDFVVGSIHSRFKMDEKEMTARVCTALENPFITMWGHPTGRLLLARKAYDVDWQKCFKAAKKHGVAIEINANPQRLDLDWRLGDQVAENEIQVCINPDAHSIEGLKDTRFGLNVAEKAMISVDQILNMKSVTEMEKFLWQRKEKAIRH